MDLNSFGESIVKHLARIANSLEVIEAATRGGAGAPAGKPTAGETKVDKGAAKSDAKKPDAKKEETAKPKHSRDEVNAALHDGIVKAWDAGGSKLRFRVMLPITFGANFLKLAAPMIPALEAAAEALPWAGTKAMMVGVLEHDLRARLKDIRAETLLIFGEDDRFTPLYHARVLQAGIPGAQLRVIPGVGHASPLENPPAVDALALAFFRGAALPA